MKVAASVEKLGERAPSAVNWLRDVGPRVAGIAGQGGEGVVGGSGQGAELPVLAALLHGLVLGQPVGHHVLHPPAHGVVVELFHVLANRLPGGDGHARGDQGEKEEPCHVGKLGDQQVTGRCEARAFMRQPLSSHDVQRGGEGTVHRNIGRA